MKKNRTIDRFLAFLLCAALLITYMPSSVYTLADEESGAPEVSADSGDSGSEADKDAPKKAETSAAPAEKVEAAPAEPEPEVVKAADDQKEEAKEPETPETRAGPSDDSDAATESAEEPAKEAEEAAVEAEEPAKEAEEAAVEAEEPAKEAEEPAKEAEEPVRKAEEKAKETEEPAYPKVNLEGKAGYVDVEVKAPEGALPEGVKLDVEKVSAEKAEKIVEDYIAEDKEINEMLSVDIKFKKDGKKVEPKKAVTVELSSGKIKGDDLAVYNEDKNYNVRKLDGIMTANSGKFERRDFARLVMVTVKDKEDSDTEEAGEEGEDAEEADPDAEAPAEEQAEEAAEETTEEAVEEQAEEVAEEQAEEVTEEVAEEAAEEELAEEPEEGLVEEELIEEPVTEDKPAYPKQEFSGSVSGVAVSVTAPEGALPEGTTMKVKGVSAFQMSSVVKAVEAEMGENAEVVKAVDITFYDADGNEVQPNKPVSVSFNSSKFAGKDDLSVVHIDDKKNADKVSDSNVENKGSKVVFEADQFSVYAVVDQGDNARLKIVFKLDQNTVLATEYVKESDFSSTNIGRIGEILYDPGTGTLPDGVTFRGWSTSPQYTAGTTSLTIDGIRNAAAGTDWANIKDGDTEGGAVVTYYAMLFKHYVITYTGEGVTLGADQAFYPCDKTGSATTTVSPYTVNQAYSTGDDTKRFDGWNAVEGSENIVDYVEGTIYTNGTNISVTGNVKFEISVSIGNWLVFDENGKGGTYVAPEFVVSGETTVAPTITMLRKGYTFDGWYDTKEHADAHGEDPSVTTGKFEFGHELESKTTIYASWIPNPNSGYTVIFWKQNSDRTGYDVAASKFVENGTVGTNIPYTFRDNDDEDYVRFNGEDYHYTGFCLKPEDANQQVEITPEGEAVLNLHYDRIVYKLRFYLYRKGSGNNSYQYAQNSNRGANVWNIVNWYNTTSLNNMPTTTYPGGIKSASVDGYTGYYIEMEAYYGEDISGKWPKYSQIQGPANNRQPVSFVMMNGTKLKPSQSSGGDSTVKGEVSIMNENILGVTNNKDGNFLIVRFNTFNEWTYHIYYELLPGEQPPAGKPTDTVGGKTYYLDHDVPSRSSNTDASQQNPPQYQGYSTVMNGDRPYYKNAGNLQLNYYFDRSAFAISYFDGTYVDGNGNPLATHSTELYKEKDGIGYGAKISEEDKNYEPPYPHEDGYVFEGWYADEGCTEKYTFNTMPEGGIKVYAKWRQIQYRVFLHPNADRDPTLDWGVLNPSLNFRIDYGKTVSVNSINRNNYVFVGWYTDAEYTNVFNESIKLNETTVTTPYDKTTHMTDPMDKWGDGATWNSDAQDEEGNPRDRFWITREYNLYAKWRAELVDAEGVNVKYDIGEGSGTAVDDNLYVDGAKAVAASAVTAPQHKEFGYWVMQTWNAKLGKYVDLEGSKIYPGQSYTVEAKYAKQEVTEQGKTTYTIQLRAHYLGEEGATPTHIKWFNNNGTNAFHTDKVASQTTPYTESTLAINEAVVIQPKPEDSVKPGYEFIGWAKVDIGSTADEVNNFYNNSANWTQNITTPYLFYNSDDNTFHLNSKTGKTVTKVAADEVAQYHAMFAVWKEKDVTINYAVASGDEDKGTVSESSETIKAATGTAAGSTAAASSTAYVFAYWTVDDGTELISKNAQYIPEKNAKGVYEEHTYYAHFKPSKADYTIHHYLDGTTTKVANDQTGTETVGESVTATAYATGSSELYEKYKAVKGSGFVPESGSIVISADSEDNVIIVYYKIPITITAASQTWPYDGETHTNTNVTKTSGNLLEGDTLVATATGSVKNVADTVTGNNPIATGYKIMHGTTDVTASYEITTEAGTLTISKVDLTIVMADRTLPYNGETQNGWSRTDTGEETVTGLVKNETVTIDYTPSSGKTVGTYNNGAYDATTLSIKDGETDVTGNYNLTSATAGKLTIEKNTTELKVASADKSWDYDADTHTYKVYTVTYGDEVIEGTEGQTEFTLPTGDKVTVTPTEKGDNGVKNVSDSGANSFTWTVENESGYTKGEDTVGTLTINKVDLTIAMEDRTLPYTGKTQYGWSRTDAGKETVSGLVNNETVTITYTPSSGQTVGTYNNGAYDTTTLSIKDGTTDVTENYNLVSATAGKLTIETTTDDLKVASATKAWDYDADTHTYKVYTVTYGDEVIEGTEGQVEFTLSTGDKVTVTPTEKGASGVKNVSDSGANSFTWTVENEGSYDKGTDTVGTLTINKVDLTIAMADRTLPYNGKTQNGWNRTDEGKETISGLVKNETVTIDYAPSSGKTVGTYTNGAYDTETLSIKDGETDVTGNYNLKSATAGELTIEKNTTELKVASASKDWDYDADTHTYKVYTVTYGSETKTGTEGQTEFTLSTGDKVTVTPTEKGANGVKNVSDNGENSFTWTVENDDCYKKGEDTVGTLTINKMDLTISMEDRTLPYNGKTQNGWSRTDEGKETVSGLVNNETVTITYTPSSGETVGTYENGTYDTTTLSIKDGTTEVKENYNLVSATAGKLTIKKAEKTLKVESASEDWDYDADTHTYKVYTVTYGTEKIEGTEGQTEFTLSTGDKVTVTPTEKGASGVKDVLDSGANSFTWTVENEGSYTKGDDTVGKLTINPKAVTVTAKSEEFTYDGTAHSNNDYDVVGLVGDDAISATVTGLITFPTESPVKNKVESYEFTKGTAGNYSVTTVDGKLTMKKASVAITITAASQAWTYDGKAHDNATVTVTSGELLTGDTLAATATGSVTNVADTATGNNPVAAGYKIKHGEVDVTDNYTITTKAGTLTIEPKAVTVTAQDKAFAYDGATHSWPEYDVDGLVGSDAITAVVTGSITYPKESPVTNKLESYEFTTGTPGNYTVTTKDGELTMTNAGTEITITAASQAWTYDGKPHQNTEVTVTSGKLLPGDALVATATGSVKNVADTAAGNNPIAAGYKIMHGDEDVTDNYAITTKAGTLTINPKQITVSADDKTVPYNGSEQEGDRTVRFSGVVEGQIASIGYDPSKGTDAGTYNNGKFADTFLVLDGTVVVTDNYELTSKTPGKLTIIQNTSKITVVPGSGSKTYDGTPFTKTAHSDFTVTGLPDGFTWTATADGTVTNVKPGEGEKAENAVTSFKIFDADGKDVTDNFGNIDTSATSNLTVEPREVTLTSESGSKTYDGTPLTKTNVTVGGDGFVAGQGAAYNVTGSQTLVGESKNTFTYTAKTGTDLNNYKITKTEGTLKVTDGTDPGETEVDDDLVVTKSTKDADVKFGETATFDISATNIYEDARTITLEEIDGVTLAKSSFENVAGGETVTTTATYKITESDVITGSFRNTVTAKVGNVTKTADATVTTEKKNPHLTVSKRTIGRTPANGYELGNEITYEIRVTNDGNVTLTDVEVKDTLVTFADDSGRIDSLAPGASRRYRYQYTVTEADVAAGSVINSATASGTDPVDDPITADDEVTVPTDDGDEPDDDDPDGGGTTPGGGGNPGGGTPAGGGTPGVTPGGGVTPADGTVVPDNPVPEVEPEVDIVDPEPPLAQGTWALINLISAILTTLGAAVALFRKKEEDDEEEEDQEGEKKQKPEGEEEEEEDDNRGKKMLASKIAGAVAGVAAPITFLLTEDMSNPMALIDKWTLLMLIMLAAQIVAAVLNKKASELDEEEEDAEAEPAN